MKIALIGPGGRRCPPLGYGSTELILWFLTRRLTLMGHKVFLMVRPDSIVVASDVCGVVGDHQIEAWRGCGWKSTEFDVVHDKVGGHALIHYILDRENPNVAAVTTEHGTRLPDGPQPCAISQDQADRWERPFVPVLYNGVDPEFYRYCEAKEDWVLYLGSVQEIKGVVDWIEVVAAAGLPGIIAGNAHEPHCPGYWRQKCLPIMPKNVEREGEVRGERKANLFAKARCLLFLPQVREAFGTVVIESLVSGTPVVTWDFGPMREIVEDGVSGFVVPYGDHQAAVKAVKAASKLSPFNCLQRGRQFSDERMAQAHLAVYKRVSGGERWT